MPGARPRKKRPNRFSDFEMTERSLRAAAYDQVGVGDSTASEETGVLITMKVAERPPKTQLRKRKSTTEEPQCSTAPKQYAVTKKRSHNDRFFDLVCLFFGVELRNHDDVSAYVYKPAKVAGNYINWTFHASFSAVFLSFFVFFFLLCLFFAGLFALAGEFSPECLVVGGDQYGVNLASKFADAFATSWTTFTTVGYGNVYPATGNDFGTRPRGCAGVVFLCTLESFLGLVYAGMAAAILFGKVSRIESYAHLTFSNPVCLQYAEVDMDFWDEESSDSDCDSNRSIAAPEEDEEVTPADDVTLKNVRFHEVKPRTSSMTHSFARKRLSRKSFKERYRGCPVLRFQVVNELANRRGSEIIDGLMKVVGVKYKRCGGKICQKQLVRVNLVDLENPFFNNVWHGTHVLDESSPLLTRAARKGIKTNGGTWPKKWFRQASEIGRKLDFQNLIVTVAGLSNLSGCNVHAYKYYKIEDVIFGFDFAPLLYANEKTGKLEVDLDLVNDVREQCKGTGGVFEETNCSYGSSTYYHLKPSFRDQQ